MPDSRNSSTIKSEISDLFAEPFAAGNIIMRRGKHVAVLVGTNDRKGDDSLDLVLTVLPTYRDGEAITNRIDIAQAIDAAVSLIETGTEPQRLSACRRLGQLGDPTVRGLLEHLHEVDASPYVRSAASASLSLLDINRLDLADVTGHEVLLLTSESGDQVSAVSGVLDNNGTVRFGGKTRDQPCRLYLLGSSETLKLPTFATANESLAALSISASSNRGVYLCDLGDIRIKVEMYSGRDQIQFQLTSLDRIMGSVRIYLRSFDTNGYLIHEGVMSLIEGAASLELVSAAYARNNAVSLELFSLGALAAIH